MPTFEEGPFLPTLMKLVEVERFSTLRPLPSAPNVECENSDTRDAMHPRLVFG